MRKKVLGVGEIVLDKVHKVSAFPEEGEKIIAQEVQLALGGPVPVALILLARLGVECTLVASIAADEAGKIVKAILVKEEVHLVAQKGVKTPVNTVLVNEVTGSRTIVKDTQKCDFLGAISAELVQSADGILCDRHEPAATFEALRVKRPQTFAIMDPSTDCSSGTLRLLKRMDFPIVPIETVRILFPQGTIKDGTKKLSLLLGKSIVVTMGKFGSAVCENDTFVIYPSFPVKVVDTLGAGDIFRGGFAFGILHGWNIHQCTQFANSVAALQCTKLGNSTAIPTKAEIITFQKSTICIAHSIPIL